jgi:hypothetical protein
MKDTEMDKTKIVPTCETLPGGSWDTRERLCAIELGNSKFISTVSAPSLLRCDNCNMIFPVSIKPMRWKLRLLRRHPEALLLALTTWGSEGCNSSLSSLGFKELCSLIQHKDPIAHKSLLFVRLLLFLGNDITVHSTDVQTVQPHSDPCASAADRGLQTTHQLIWCLVTTLSSVLVATPLTTWNN